MTTRDELIGGLQFLVQEGQRMGADLTEDQWAKAVDFDGWKNKEVLAHVASIGTIVVPMMSAWQNAEPGADVFGGVDINALNAQLVAARAGKPIGEITDELAKAYGGVIDWLRTVPDEALERRLTVAGYKDTPAADVMMRMVVLHGLSHVYSGYSAIMNS